jgi:hypothetical protein
LGFCRISPSSKLFLFCCFSPRLTCFHRRMQGERGVFEPHEIDQFPKKHRKPKIRILWFQSSALLISVFQHINDPKNRQY